MTDVFKVGDRVHITVRGVVTARAGLQQLAVQFTSKSFHLPNAAGSIDIDAPTVVTVERAPVDLPTNLGAVIRATLDGDEVLAARVTRIPDHVSPWSVLSRGTYHGDDEFTGVEVLFPGVEVSS